MIFPKPFDRLVLAGAKTQHRQPIRPGRMSGTVKPCSFQPGRDYAVQRAVGEQQIGRVEVVAVERETIGEITYPHGVRAEGFKTTIAFLDHWMSTHDRHWPPTEPCELCGDFDIGDERCPQCDTLGGHGVTPIAITDADVRERFEQHHADTQVWAISFELRVAPRLLAPAGDGSGFHYRTEPAAAGKKRGRLTVTEHPDDSVTDLGYTLTPARAMRGEPEAVDDVWLDRIVEDSRERWAGAPGRRAEHARRLMKANQARAKQLLEASQDPGQLLAVLEQQDRHLRLLEEQAVPSKSRRAA